ncbi:hypothetical protein F5X99DRAFT_388182 [Biscogniauxia marginata]|nr:hypothetical protein F5X99DRAFT_388182 [Biscogniauxia marginata]
MPKRGKKSKKKKKDEVDYQNRWPTQQTLVESWISERYPDEDPGKRKSKRVKALETVSLPLLWMNMKLEQWQDDIEHRVELIEARRQKRRSTSSLPEDHNAQSYRTARMTSSPGKSKHPYDTGVSEPTETEPAIPEDSIAPSSQAKPEEPPSRHRVNRTNMMRMSPNPKSTLQSRLDFARTVASQGTAVQVMPEPQERGSPRDTGKIKFSGKRISKQPREQEAKSTTSEPVEHLMESKENTGTRRRWWWPFRKTQSVDEEREVEDNSSSKESDTTEDESEDVAALIKPRSAWKSVKGRRRSGYPSTKPTTGKTGNDSAGAIRKTAQKNAAQERLDDQSRETASKPKAEAHVQPEV